MIAKMKMKKCYTYCRDALLTNTLDESTSGQMRASMMRFAASGLTL
jgi:hypothetical protein